MATEITESTEERPRLCDLCALCGHQIDGLRLSESRERVRELLGERLLEAAAVPELERPRMEERPGEPDLAREVTRAAVARIAEDRVPHVLHVGADLLRPPRVDRDPEERRARKAPHDLEAGERRLPVLGRGRLLEAVLLDLVERRRDLASLALDAPADERGVDAPYPPG